MMPMNSIMTKPPESVENATLVRASCERGTLIYALYI